MVEIKFVENLKQLMKDEGITQLQLSKSIGVSQSAISNWLKGNKEPSLTSIWLLADYFGYTVDELLGREKI